MFEKHGFSNIPNCVGCYIPEDGVLPLPVGIGDGTPTKRDVTPCEKSGVSNALLPRVSGKATLSPKRVSACNANSRFALMGIYRYPAFPRNPNWPWAEIDNGNWDSISRYWGNSSDSCGGWGVLDHYTADQRYFNGIRQRAEYQSMFSHPA
jgi:chitinase